MARFDEKVPKPYPTFPLFARDNGTWSKKIDGKKRSFGPVRWPDAIEYERSWRDALEAYHRHLEAQKRGLAVAIDPTSIDLETVANGFLTAKHAEALRGAIKPRTFADIRTKIRAYRDAMGDKTTIAELERSPKAIQAYLVALDERFGFHQYNLANQYLRSMWNWASSTEAELLTRPFKWAILHVKKPDREFRKQRRLERAAGDMPSFDAAEVAMMIAHAKPFTRALILIGYYAAYGNTDLAEIPDNALRVYERDETFFVRGRQEIVPAGWALLDFPRPKTEIDRCAVVPPIVVEAIRAVQAMKRPIASPAERHLLFRTLGGRALVYDVVHHDEAGLIKRTTPTDNIAAPFSRLIKHFGRCKTHGLVHRRKDHFGRSRRRPPAACPTCGSPIALIGRRGFYCLRHTATTFATASGASSDTRNLFEGRGGGGVRQTYYLDPSKLHDLLLIAKDLAQRLTETTGIQAPVPPVTPDASSRPAA